MLITIEMNYWLAISLVLITIRSFIINSLVEQFWIDKISISILTLLAQLLINHCLQIWRNIQLVFQTWRNVFRNDFVRVLWNNFLRIDIVGIKFKFKGVSRFCLVKKEVFWVQNVHKRETSRSYVYLLVTDYDKYFVSPIFQVQINVHILFKGKSLRIFTNTICGKGLIINELDPKIVIEN